MKTSFKPAGYNSVSPYFIIKDAEQFVQLMTAIFDAGLLRKYNRPDGSIMHAELKLYDSVIMLAEATEQYPPVPMVLHVYVQDLDTVFTRAKEAGCKVLEEPKQREGDPDRRATFMDFGGNMWSVGTQLAV
ncbi:VOC family protein [Flavihumibacter sp. CACIAM 22H1]|uniref:VOC family protein n=1 Tax=Flavihumibacter sp. CACIAM 22H1 TaxID=1812911 RepID=UPI0007A7D25F|nr:VOC family protein [Flavihumibacter sp. CACIAM 22H1]KYP16131.1 MAG: extradiol dioxygenase [Flavihumibacter sp. CACIAM 22H1]